MQEDETENVGEVQPSTSKREAFKYEELPGGQDHIRLLTILSDHTQPRDAIYCTLKTYALDKTPPYHALSYVWGTTSQSQAIICSEKELKVTPSLHATLSVLRNNQMAGSTAEDGSVIEATSPIWIDQICINQDDESERAQQVGIMKDIYQKASLVLINLGEIFDNALGTTVCNLVEQINEVCFSLKGERDNPHPYFPKDDLLRFWGLPARADESWPALGSTTSLPYFERVWTVQEVLMARDAVVLYPGGLIRWDMFTDASVWLITKDFGNRDPSPNDSQGGIHFPRILTFYWEARRHPKKWRIYDLVRSTIQLKSTDPRDKIFALAGLVLDGEEVAISYAKSPMQVFEEFARHAINSEESLRILSDAQHTYPEDRGKPSWVPRWDKARISPSMLEMNFDAASGTKASVDLHPMQGILNVLGLETDFVTAKVHLAEPDDPGVKWLSNLYASFVEAASISETTPKPVLAERFRGMTWCLVLGEHLDQPEALSSCEADNHLLDDLCSYIFTRLCRLVVLNKYQEACKGLLHLIQVVFEAHHNYPFSIEHPPTIVETYDWLWGMIQIVDPVSFENAQKVDELASYIVAVINTKPDRDIRFHLRCMADGAVSLSMRSLFGTGKGFIGLGPPQLEKGDIICVLYGGPTLYALRPTSVPGEYTYLGDCYVHGQMHGQALNPSRAEEKRFRLV